MQRQRFLKLVIFAALAVVIGTTSIGWRWYDEIDESTPASPGDRTELFKQDTRVAELKDETTLTEAIESQKPDDNRHNLLAQYETYDKEFERTEIGGLIVYFHKRTINGAIVEGDYIVYQFDKNTKNLLKKRVHWRDNLPESITPLIPKEEAESMVRGGVQFTRLYIISPESDVFPLEPTPQNPCWVVRSIDDGNSAVTIIDAMDGEMLGHGIAPPYGGFSFSGPVEYTDTCADAWEEWYQNAETWFNEMGYPTDAVEWPTEEKTRSHIQSCSTVLFYQLAHGHSYTFVNSCSDSTYASEIHDWIVDHAKMPFAFIGGCDGMCNVSSGTFSYEFRKGSMKNAVTVGYCHMADVLCDDAWTYSVVWQDTMFSYMNEGHTIKGAFDQAVADYPMCENCVRFAGDESLVVVPVIRRNQEPVLSDGCVTPGNGNIDTVFTYSVSYYDEDGDMPTDAYVYVEGDPCEMYVQPPDDSVYIFETTLSEGVHDYHFYFEDACGTSRLPESGVLIGPDVLGLPFIRADANGDMVKTIADAIYIITYVYREGPCVCQDACDANDDGRVTVADAIYVVSFIYRSGLPPPSPFENCDLDPTEDELGCQSHPCATGGYRMDKEAESKR